VEDIIMEDIVNEKFKQVDKTLDNHEERISETEKKCQDMDKHYSLAISETSQTNKILSDVLKEVKEAVVDIRKILEDSVRRQDRFETTQDDIKQTQKKQGEKIDLITDKIEKVDKKGTVDILKWLEKNWFPAALALGGIIAIASRFIDF
jgi:chromosome segregation ATPase